MYGRGDEALVGDMLVACKRILAYTAGLSYEAFRENPMVIDAVARNIEILGEAAKNVSGDLQKKYPEIAWREIARTRDKIIHFYFGVDTEVLWDIIEVDIPVLKTKLEGLLEAESWEIPDA